MAAGASTTSCTTLPVAVLISEYTPEVDDDISIRRK